ATGAMSGFAREKAYVRRIEKRFLALRAGGLTLSPRDFALLLDWHHRGVPADLVLATIEAVITRSATRSRARKIQSISYCRHAVEEAWEERRAAMIGADAPAASPPRGALATEEVVDHLDRVSGLVREAGEAFPPSRGGGARSAGDPAAGGPAAEVTAPG